MYSIVRYYHPSLNKPSEVIATGVTLEAAQDHCNDPDTKVEGEYFDGYRRE
jgi:hypothetical protein